MPHPTLDAVPLRCTIGELIRATFRALLLRHGCSKDEADKVQVYDDTNGVHPGLASVRHEGNRELYRVYDLEDLDSLAGDPLKCAFLARRVRRSQIG